MAIPRAIVYHPMWFDLTNYLSAFRSLDRVPVAEARKKVTKFEQAFASYMGAKHATAFPLARTALYFILKAKNFEPGSEIIMPPITIKPMMDVVINLGLTPVFVDIERDTLCFDVEQLKQAITPRARAILVTYLFGVAPDLDPLLSVCKSHGLLVIEDFSHALNASYKGRKLGTHGDVSIYSCSRTKTLDAYGGGLAVTDNAVLAGELEKAQLTLKPASLSRIRRTIASTLVWNLATRRPIFTVAVSPMLRLLGRINPALQKKMTGARLNLKPDTRLPDEYFEAFTWLQAAAGLAMLEKVESEDKQRIENASYLRRSLAALGEPYVKAIDGARSVYWQFVVFSQDSVAFQQALALRGVDTGTTNLSLVCGLGIYPTYEKRCPNAEYIKTNAMYIPVYPRLKPHSLDHIQAAVREAFQKSRIGHA